MKDRFQLQSKSTIWCRIRGLNIPEPTKQKLRELWHKAKALVQLICEWIYNRREFCASVMLGAALAYLIQPLPIVGPVLASLCMPMFIFYGIIRQFKADMDRHFSFVVNGQCA